LLGALGVVLTWWQLEHGPSNLTLLSYAATMLAFVWATARLSRILRQDPNPEITEVDCRADDAAVYIGARTLARHTIQSASVVERRDGAQVEIVVAPSLSPRIRLRVDSVQAGQALLEALALDVRHQAASFVTGPPLRATPAWVMVGTVIAGLALSVASAWWSSPLAALLFVAPLLAILTPQKVVVGADGLRVTWGPRSRFVPFDAIEAVHEEASFAERRLVVTVTGAHPLLIPLGSDKTLEYLAPLRTRIEAARQQHAAGDLADASGALGRGDHDHPSWLERLRALTQVGQHRRGAVVEGALWRILESPATPPLSRAAAAVALEPRLDSRTRLRIEDVARSTASAELRQVLEAEEDAALAEALAALEAKVDPPPVMPATNAGDRSRSAHGARCRPGVAAGG
jgi:hypothetical protein